MPLLDRSWVLSRYASALHRKSRRDMSHQAPFLCAVPRRNVQRIQHRESDKKLFHLKTTPKSPNHVSVPTASNLVIYTFAPPPFTIAAVLIGTMACMRETGQSLTRPLRAHPVVAGFAEAVLPKAKMQILVGDRYDKNALAPT